MTTLQTELTSGPLAAELAPFVASGNEAAISEIMNRQDITVKGKLLTHDIRQYLMLVDLLLPIEAGLDPACKTASRALDIFPQFDLSNSMILAKFSAILDGLVADALTPAFTATTKATLLAMADRQISRAEQLGITISDLDIRKAIWNDNGTRAI